MITSTTRIKQADYLRQGGAGLKYAIKAGRDFYIGRTYTHQGEFFPGVTDQQAKIKWYKTLAIAKRAKATLKNKISHEHNIYIVDESDNEVE